MVAEKRNDQLLGYDSVSVREGERESLRAAGTFYDRREAAEFIGRRAAQRSRAIRRACGS
jgi:hypothetical protein